MTYRFSACSSAFCNSTIASSMSAALCASSSRLFLNRRSRNRRILRSRWGRAVPINAMANNRTTSGLELDGKTTVLAPTEQTQRGELGADRFACRASETYGSANIPAGTAISTVGLRAYPEAMIAAALGLHP